MADTEQLHHVDLGDGPSIVLIHGLASCLHLWDGVARRLEDSRHRVVACDLRGHGHSPKPDPIPFQAPAHPPAPDSPTPSSHTDLDIPTPPGGTDPDPPIPPGPYDVPTVAADVIALIERLQLGACLLVGQSYGGTVAMQVAADRPDLTAAVVCVDGGFLDLGRRYPDWEKCRRDLSPPRLTGRPLKAITFRMRAERPGWPEEGLAGQLACFEVRDDETVAPWLTLERHLEVLRGLWSVDAPALWSQVAAPVLLVAAERPGSPAKSPWHDDVGRCRTVLAGHTRAEVVWMQGDHDLHAQHPDEVARLIERWGQGQL